LALALPLPPATLNFAIFQSTSTTHQHHFDFTMTVNDTPAEKAQKRKTAQETLKWGTGKHSTAINTDTS
jgi:hypothetical protein